MSKQHRLFKQSTKKRMSHFTAQPFYYWILLVFLSGCVVSQDQIYLNGNQSPEYDDLIDYYKVKAREYSDISLYVMGESDFGKPIYICVLGATSDSLETFLRARNSTVLLINNAIHPGEPCGVNASMQLVEDYALASTASKKDWPIVAIIPAYNIGGMHNRSSTSRANQNGPESHGFRGNARNLDLNRDFIKMDSQNAWTFAKIFHALDPDVFIDTHTSNGADYQHTMTYIGPLKGRCDAGISELVYDKMLPDVEKHLEEQWGMDLIPYVSMNGKTLDQGIHAFNATPRYATGYVELFNTLAITTEAHMLKPFEDRVKATYGFITGTIKWMSGNRDEIELRRSAAFERQLKMESVPILFERAAHQPHTILLKGYEWEMRASELTQQDRLYYNRDKPVDLEIPFHDVYVPKDSIVVPNFILVRGHETEVIKRLSANNVTFNRSEKTEMTLVYQFIIQGMETGKSPFEGHFLHSHITADERSALIRIEKGDYIIPVRQRNIQFILHVLFPQNEDSYFAWNFFDSYLQQKEYFSDYVFEEKALEFLMNNPDIEKEFREKQRSDESFASNRWSQLMWIYQRTDYYEGKTHRVLPIFLLRD